jgi:hypothetical protein
MIALLRQYLSRIEVRHCPVVLIYGAVTAANVLLITRSSASASPMDDQQFKFVMKTLSTCAESHPFAAKARLRLLRVADGLQKAAGANVEELQTAAEGTAGVQNNPEADELTSQPWMNWPSSSLFDPDSFMDFDMRGVMFDEGDMAAFSTYNQQSWQMP